MPLQAMIKQRLRKLVRLPRYGPLGLSDPQQDVEVWLRGAGEPVDVTRNNVVVALRPFTIGVMFDRHHSVESGNPLRLCMHEARGAKRLLGSIGLRPAGTISLPEHRFCLFEPSGYENYCAPALSLALYYLRARRRAARSTRRNPHNFQMSHADLRSNFVFYICPRPVVLVTVEHEGSSNIFPMDLIGPTDSPWYTMALRSTSPAVRLMQQSRRMALASVPFAVRDVAYALGKHHALSSIDWADIPLPTAPSPLFGLPVPDAALKIREVRVREFHEVGSHVLFVTSIERETNPGNEGPQLFHSFSPWSDVTPPVRSSSTHQA